MEIISDDISLQAKQVFENLSSVANAAGGSLADSVKINISMTDLADFCVDGTQEKVDEAEAKLLSGECNVFDGVIETNDGSTIGQEGATLDDATITGDIHWYFKNVSVID